MARTKEQTAEQNRRYYERHRERRLLEAAAYREANRDEILQRRRQWAARNKDVVAERNAAWVAANPAANAAKTARRRAAMQRRQPAWADIAAIKAVYAECARITEETGVPHDVDHIVPIRGRVVSGLHVHNNLQILPASRNRSKGNHFLPGDNPPTD